jgi:hypothetical protein
MKRDVKYCLQYMFGLHSFRYKAAKTRNTVPKEVEFYTDTLYNLIGDGRNLVYYIQGLSEKLGGGGGGPIFMSGALLLPKMSSLCLER